MLMHWTQQKYTYNKPFFERFILMPQPQTIPIELFTPLLLHADPVVQRQSAQIFFISYGEEGLRQFQARIRQGDVDERRQVREALDCLARHIPARIATYVPFAGLQIDCLGIMRVWADGAPLLPQLGERDQGRAGAHKLRTVLAVLFEAGGRGITREALAEAVWGRTSEASGLARTLTSLRKLISTTGGEELAEAVLMLSDSRCLLHPDYVRSDVAHFERLCTLAAETEEREGLAAAAGLYAQALELYRGPYMADVPTTWGALIERRSLLVGDYLNMSERLAEHNYTQGRFHACEQLCTQALAEDGAADDLTVWLLRAHAQIGHYAELEHAYQRYLRAARITPDAAHDPVVQAYGAIQRERMVG
jgi:DNA-binding SARP family transcriptional activator